MSNIEWFKAIQYKIDDSFASNFDELINIQAKSRKSDIWFSEKTKLMICPRPWTTRVWDITSGAWWVSKEYFFTDFKRKRWHIKWYNHRWYYLNWNSWISLWDTFTWNSFNFNSFRLPINLDWTESTEYTNWTSTIAAETISIASWDSTVSPIWKILIITDDTAWNQSYRWCFWTIINNADWVYTLQWSWILTWVKSWAKYEIYDTLWFYLQVSTWEDLDRYYCIRNDWLLYENTSFRWFATYSLRNIKALLSTEFLTKQVSFDNSIWTFNKWTLFYSSWALNNPFFYDFTWALTLPNSSWDINDIFIFKKRLVIWWINFISYLNASDTLKVVNLVTDKYWIKENSLNDLWSDAYIISTNNKLYSLSETLAWSLVINNVWSQVNNYLKNFNVKIATWFDGSRLYLYWQKDISTPWVILVLDIDYKFWSVWTWIYPSCIINENNITYFWDLNSWNIYFFDDTVFTDNWNAIEQKISFKEVDLSDVFTPKMLWNIFLWLDNFNQKFIVNLYAAWTENNTLFLSESYNIEEILIPQENNPIWAWLIGENIIWWFTIDSNVTYPYLKKIQVWNDKANIWKISIIGKDWWAFYLNQLDIQVWNDVDTKNYFNPSLTR